MDWLPIVYETASVNVLNEWYKKFNNTYVRLNGQLVLARGLDDSYMIFSDEVGNLMRIKVNTDQKVDISFPQTGCFSHNESFAIFTRTPARQFKKGLCSDNARVLFPLQGSRVMGYITLNFDVLRSAFNPVFHHPHTTLEQIWRAKGKWYSGGAVSKDWGIRNHPLNERAAILFFREFAVGEIDDSGKCSLVVPSFEQEILDFNKQFGVGLTLK